MDLFFLLVGDLDTYVRIPQAAIKSTRGHNVCFGPHLIVKG